MVRHLKITVEGKIYDVVVEDVTEGSSGASLYPTPGSMAALRHGCTGGSGPCNAGARSTACRRWLGRQDGPAWRA